MAEPAIAEDDSDELGEIQVAEYVILLLAIQSFAEHVEVTTGGPANDEHTHKGIRLLRLADDGDLMRDFFLERFTREESKLTIRRTFQVRVNSVVQAGRRAQTLMTAFSRGGSAAFIAVFDESRARNAVKTSMAASKLDEPGAALDRYGALPIRNARIKTWIKKARDLVDSGESIHNPVESAAAAALDHVKKLRTEKVIEEGAMGSEAFQESQEKRTGMFEQLQVEATEAARAAIEVSGEEDTPPKRSEVIGLATAAAVAAVADVSNTTNVPESIRSLDLEQRAAALSDGRVLVAAGAGAGKSTTVVARANYLVTERGVPPERILVCCFNRKAANELQAKVGKSIGVDRAKRMTVDTMHTIFKRKVIQFGNPQQKALFDKVPKSVSTGATIASTVNRIWRKCYATFNEETREFKDAEPPSVKAMKLAKTKWAGDSVSPAQALAKATTEKEKEAARWYEMYEGLKGSVRWNPSDCANPAAVSYSYKKFVDDFRMLNGKPRRIGDFDDMISAFGDVLESNPIVRKRLQGSLDHIMVDEGQDLNAAQYRAMNLLTEHIGDGSDGKSFWIVGDPDQSVNGFRGARPEQFVALDGKPGWKTQLLRTNYRCPPEVVDAGNRLIALNSQRMEKVALAAPHKVRGDASIEASVYPDEAATAIAVAGEIESRWDFGKGVPAKDNAVLCATNAELNSYEMALLMKGIPYARKGASSFLSSPETKAFLGYVSLATDADAVKGQEALGMILNKPNRFFIYDEEKLKGAVDAAVNGYARKKGVSKSEVNVVVAMRDSRFRQEIASALRGGNKPPDYYLEGLESLSMSLDELSFLAINEGATTQSLFKAILDVPGMDWKKDPKTDAIIGQQIVTFREALSSSQKDYGGGDDVGDSDEAADEVDEGEGDQLITTGLGNVSFLFELAKINPADPSDIDLPPDTPKGFWAKMARLKERAGELRVDLDKWDKEEPPAAVYLGTVHSVKGAEWPYVTVQMPKGRFPMIPRTEPGEVLTPEKMADQAGELEGSRRLAYVAMTRPSKELRIVAPARYDGKPAGMSQFLAEAGLTLGENVQRGGEVPKTAEAFFEDVGSLAAGAL